ncbi:class I SAM-dependent methyltransferase, partial [bacterium]|nr:class I SAM-dependent methyltransferase [bacterium]
MTMLDVGSGSGIPGIPLAILHPDQHLVIVEANNKK